MIQQPQQTPAVPPVDLSQLPTEPGVYLFKDTAGEVLYVGKAIKLRHRVRQYWQREAQGDGRFHIGFLVPRIAEVEVVVTRSEREALILEDNLIKKYQPRYNVRLKDDKSWLSLRLDVRARFPRVTTVRRWRDDGSRYFGPYLNHVKARDVDKLLRRTLPLRTCSDAVFRNHATRPCIEHQLGRCGGPCAGLVSEEQYAETVREAILLLEGRHDELCGRMEARMLEHSEALRFEEAARLRDAIQLIRRLADRQSARGDLENDRDVFGLHREGPLAAIALMPMREGRLEDARAFTFRGVVEDDGELVGRLITQLYGATIPPPQEILVPVAVPDATLRAELLSELAGRRVHIKHPRRGDKRRLVELAQKNAALRFESAHSKQERKEQAMFGLQKALRLPHLPRRIECYDNSNIGGSDPVGSMVSFVDGAPDKGGYRVFKIRTVEGADDYATMHEVLTRRLKRALDGEGGWELPDLLVIDGGRGQLRHVRVVCEELGIRVGLPEGLSELGAPRAAEATADYGAAPVLFLASIAKPLEREPTDKIFQPGRKGPLHLRAHDPALRLLQAARDEAHRFGVSHHRKQRRKRTLRSQLDDVPGVGTVLRRRLLLQFGSLTALRQASEEQIAAVQGVGPRRARAIAEALRN